MKKIVFTGPESSGKSTLAEKAAERFGLNLVPEFARTYLEINGSSYNYSDLVKIAKGQLDSERQLDKTAEFQILDTDILTIKIWSEFKYGGCDPFIKEQVSMLKNRHYFLFKPDIKWTSDPLRESPNDRDRLFDIYQSEIEKLGATYTMVSGSYIDRKTVVFKAIENLFGK